MLTQETKRKIDSARNILVGKVPDPKAQVEQITTALIYKFMDDMDKEAIELGGKARFFTQGFEKYAWTKLLDQKLGGHERLELYGEAVAKMSQNPHIPQLFRDIFKDAFLPYRSPETLTLFLKEINGFTYDHSEDLGDAFEYLLSILGSQGDAGQFRTPRHIIDFIAGVVDPKKGDKILDPACGTAGFLISAYKHILKQQKDKPLTPDEKKKLMNNLVGYDISPDMVKLSKVNMYLHGFAEPKIFEYDTLSSEEKWDEIYDVILANPPFMTPSGGIRPHKRFSVQANRAEVLFVDYIMEHLRPNGRSGVIVPDGIISTKGRDFASLRKNLINNGLYAVIDLPAGIFEPYSKVKTSVLFINKSLKFSDVIFIKISPLEKSNSYEINQSTLLNTELILNQLSQVVVEIKESGFVSPSLNKEIKILAKEKILNSKNSFLKPEYYFDDSPHELWGMVALSQILEKSGEKVGSKKKIPVMSITMDRGLIDQSEKFKKRIANVDISKYKLVRKNELVVGFPIDEGVLGFQTKYEFAAVSPAYDIWKISRTDIPVEYLEKILRSPEAVELYKSAMKGTANRRRVVPKDIFLSLKIPLPSKKVVETINRYILSLKKENIDLSNKILANKKSLGNRLSGVWSKK